jgi:formylglycine-generating enzyme required for sulfatase activity
MGCPPEEVGCTHSWEALHTVTLTHDFEILSTEVTQGDFEALMGYNTSSPIPCGDDCPMATVDWYESAAYCNELSDDAGLAQCYDCVGSGTSVACTPSDDYATPYDCPGYRLPTEAEWEYAARAGTTTATYNGNAAGGGPESCSNPEVDPILGPIAWYCVNASDGIHESGTRAPNDWGLYDVLGNVYEWCHDWHQWNLGEEPMTDPWGPEGPDTGGRVARGGSWRNYADFIRAADRSTNPEPDYDVGAYIGLRPVRSIGP